MNTLDIGWLLIAYSTGTFIGWYFALKAKSENIVAATIDSLVEEGYLKTKGSGDDMEVLKWREWINDQDTGKNS
jgi:hypothetical protein